MLVLLPWIVLLGASIELPAAVLLRDGCDQLEDFTYRTLTTVRQSSYPGSNFGSNPSSSPSSNPSHNHPTSNPNPNPYPYPN